MTNFNIPAAVKRCGDNNKKRKCQKYEKSRHKMGRSFIRLFVKATLKLEKSNFRRPVYCNKKYLRSINVPVLCFI